MDFVTRPNLDLRKIQHGCNCLRNAGGTPLAAASSCITHFFATFLSNGKRMWCSALRRYLCVMMETTCKATNASNFRKCCNYGIIIPTVFKPFWQVRVLWRHYVVVVVSRDRVYLDGDYKEPPSHLVPPPPVVEEINDCTCLILWQ